MFKLFLIFMILLAAGITLAIKYLPFWAIAVAAIVFLILARYLGGYLLKQLFLAPFRAKGAVLRGARVEIHGVAPTSKPAAAKDGDADIDAEDSKDACYYALDVSIHPKDAKGPFRSYDPAEISFMEFGKAIDVDEPDDESSLGQVVKVEVFHDGKYHAYDENAPESNRFRLTARVKPNAKKLAFRYYFESFGELALPQA